MRKGKEEGYQISDTGNWNSAKDFSRIKIMKLLDNCDVYENIAEFGHDSILDELMNFNVPTNLVRLSGLKRLIKELIKLCNNAKFAMKKSGTDKKLEEYRLKLKVLDERFPKTFESVSKRSGNEFSIKEDFFRKILDKVIEVKADLNFPLNQNHLIFVDKEEFDPKTFKEKIKEGATSRG